MANSRNKKHTTTERAMNRWVDLYMDWLNASREEREQIGRRMAKLEAKYNLPKHPIPDNAVSVFLGAPTIEYVKPGVSA